MSDSDSDFVVPQAKRPKASSSGHSGSYVKQRLIALLGTFDKKHQMFGAMTDKKLVLLRSSSDARVLTWEKLINQVADRVVNAPDSDECCWFIPANLAGTSASRSTTTNLAVHHFKLSSNGASNKWQTHRILHVLAHPDDYPAIGNKDENKDSKHVAHRCGRGKAASKGMPCCVNPFHTVMVEAKVNQDHKGCKYGAAFLCPHAPKCLFTWPDTGKPKPCFNHSEWPTTACNHQPVCSHH
jgi:hypothetical protein